MDPIFLNAVRAAAADVAADTAGTAVAVSVAADTAGTAVAVSVADIAGAAADIFTDARAALAGAAANTAVVARAAPAGAAADTAAVATAADSSGDLYRRACRFRRHYGLHVLRSARSGRRFWL